MIYSSSRFSHFAKWTAQATGHPAAFIIAALIIIVWGVTGPIFKFSDTWQLIINTGGISDSEYPESRYSNSNELIRAVGGAHNALLDLEGLEEADLERFRVRYEELARTAREALGRGELDTGTPEVRPD